MAETGKGSRDAYPGETGFNAYSYGAALTLAAEKQGLIGDLGDSTRVGLKVLGPAMGAAGAVTEAANDVASGMNPAEAAAHVVGSVLAGGRATAACAKGGPLAAAGCGIGAGLTYGFYKDKLAEAEQAELTPERQAINKYLNNKRLEDWANPPKLGDDPSDRAWNRAVQEVESARKYGYSDKQIADAIEAGVPVRDVYNESYFGDITPKPPTRQTQTPPHVNNNGQPTRKNETPPHVNNNGQPKPENPFTDPSGAESRAADRRMQDWHDRYERGDPSPTRQSENGGQRSADDDRAPVNQPSKSYDPLSSISSPSKSGFSGYGGGGGRDSGAKGGGGMGSYNKPSSSAPANKDDDDDKDRGSRNDATKTEPAKTDQNNPGPGATGAKNEGGKKGSDPIGPEKPATGWGGARPVLLDLDGDGVEITELSRSSVFMDAGGNGLLHRTAWAGTGDGVLFFDANNDGKIGEKREYVFTEWDPTATSDLEALRAAFDSNGDARLTAADAAFAQFKVLVTNPDGSLTAKTLSELGITGINLKGDATHITLPDGSVITGQSTFTKADGTTGTTADVTLVAEALGRRVVQTESMDDNGARTAVSMALAVSRRRPPRSQRRTRLRRGACAAAAPSRLTDVALSKLAAGDFVFG